MPEGQDGPEQDRCPHGAGQGPQRWRSGACEGTGSPACLRSTHPSAPPSTGQVSLLCVPSHQTNLQALVLCTEHFQLRSWT